MPARNKNVAVIGSGFSGLAAACFLAREGCNVTVYEKNSTVGGRARAYQKDGFFFDMGPSWYWMPDIFERFFAEFGKKPSDYYELVKLDPGFQMIFGDDDILPVPANLDALYALFESIEKGSAEQLKRFMKEGEFKYKVGMKDLVYKPAFSWFEFATKDVITGALKMDVFKSMSAYVRRFFKDARLRALMEFPVLFLGAMPDKIPALYSLMNFAALDMGTWYPIKGMAEIPNAMYALAKELGVHFELDCEVKRVIIERDNVTKVSTSKGVFLANGVVGAGDYNHIDQHIVPEEFRNYNADYWEKKTFAPSCLIFYIGVNKKVKRLIHHNLFFDTDFDKHSKEIYQNPQWPEDPLFYACVPSKTDSNVAPEGMENIFILIPVAPGLEDSEPVRERYYGKIIERLEKYTGDAIAAHVVHKRSYCINDFKADYNAFKGNAYGLANTLMQTAVLKPSLKNKKLSNLFYAGQLTVPGPGVPPALISGQLAAEQLLKTFN